MFLTKLFVNNFNSLEKGAPYKCPESLCTLLCYNCMVTHGGKHLKHGFLTFAIKNAKTHPESQPLFLSVFLPSS